MNAGTSAPNYATYLSQIRSHYRPHGQYEQIRRRKKSLTPTRVQAPDNPTWSMSLRQLQFPGPHIYSLHWTFIKNNHSKTIISNSVITHSMETKYDLTLNQCFLRIFGKFILTSTFQLKFTMFCSRAEFAKYIPNVSLLRI